MTVIGRHVSELEDAGGNVLPSGFDTDAQPRWARPSFADRFTFAPGVNTLFNKRTPGCVACETNYFSQTVHDIPGSPLPAPRIQPAADVARHKRACYPRAGAALRAPPW